MVRQIILLLAALACSSANAAFETGPANSVLRVPAAGGRPKMGAVNLSSTAAVTGNLPNANLAQAPAFTLRGNNTAAAATPTDATLGAVRTALAVPPIPHVFTSAGTFTLYLDYAFTTTSASATQGATYTNNSQTCTIDYTVASANLVVGYCTGAPSSSGTLTKATGTGDATITFTSMAPPLVMEAFACGGGGGGGSGNGGNAGGGGGNANLGGGLAVGIGGSQGGAGSNGGGPGGGYSYSAPFVPKRFGYGNGGGASAVFSGGGAAPGGTGGGGWAMGAGAWAPTWTTASVAGAAAPGPCGGGGGGIGPANGVSGSGGGGGGGIEGYMYFPLTYSATYSVVIGAAGTGGAGVSGGGAGGAGGLPFLYTLSRWQ